MTDEDETFGAVWTHEAPGVDASGLITCARHSACVAGILRPEFATRRLEIHVGPPEEPQHDSWIKRLFLRGGK